MGRYHLPIYLTYWFQKLHIFSYLKAEIVEIEENTEIEASKNNCLYKGLRIV